MHPSYLLVAMATMSHAWIFPTAKDIAARSPWRTNIQRSDNPQRGTLKPNATLPDGKGTKTYCPKFDASHGADTQTAMKPEDLGVAEERAMAFCGAQGKVLTNDVDGQNPGHVFGVIIPSLPPGKNETGPYVQICSAVEQGEPDFNCTRDILSLMLDEIACGSREKPTQGFGTVIDKGQEKPEKYYVWYGPTMPGPCISGGDFVKKDWASNGDYYKQGSEPIKDPPGQNNDNNVVTDPNVVVN